ncbi:hypothetical protein IFM89_004278 [Coptis chinensis]|uniref:Aminotransferase-like plant mobile domain-containing protein n=1 Tax=Coptis chinensis TaxID=261450 RepID=A0A835M1F9_9MAGN|nr:hypothetical protein IFM89_004278 [Coptis chinensis]
MINCMIFVVMSPKTRGAKASQVQPSAAKLSRADKQPQTASFRKNHNQRKQGKNVIEEEIPSISVSEEENLEESNSIDSQEGAQEYSDKIFILSLKKKKEKAKGPDVRDEYPKESPFPGGPMTMTVSRWYYEHVSFLVWLGKERGVLKTHQHTMKMLAWVVEGKCTTFWQKAYAKQLLVQGLSPAVTEAEIDEELNDCGGVGKAVSLGWLRSKLAGKENNKDSEIIDNCVRGYLLYLLGCVLFPNKSGDKISVAYMKFLLNLEKVKDYAWALVEAWVYEHFPCFRPLYNSEYTIDMPRMKRWLVRTNTVDAFVVLMIWRLITKIGYCANLVGFKGHQWSQWFNHVLNETMRGTAIVDSSDCDPKYIEWYYSVSHPRVQNPVRCSGLFKRASVVARPTYDELISRISKAKSILKTLMDGGSAIAKIIEAYQILSIDDSSPSSASKDLVDGSSASFASKDPVHNSSATSASTNPVGGPKNEGCVAVVSNDGSPVNVKKRKTTGPGLGPTQGRGRGRGRSQGSRKK